MQMFASFFLEIDITFAKTRKKWYNKEVSEYKYLSPIIGERRKKWKLKNYGSG